jgi:ATP-dependent exoDNAse (exonuclease V) beta subunit
MLGVEWGFGLRRDDLIVKDGDLFAVEERQAAYERWRDERRATIARASRRSIALETVTGWTRTERVGQDVSTNSLHGPAFPVDVVAVGAPGRRPYGPRFGTLVHALLATVPLDADESSVRRVAETHWRIRAATAEERDAAVRVALDVLAHPLLARARDTSARCRRELPVTWRAEDGTLVEGTIDFAIEDADGTTVLDFKTDRELSTDLDRYRRQLTIYCRALQAARGSSPRGVLMRI